MSKESLAWKPADWSITKARMFTDQVYLHAGMALLSWWGAQEGMKHAAEVLAERKARQSKQSV